MPSTTCQDGGANKFQRARSTQRMPDNGFRGRNDKGAAHGHRSSGLQSFSFWPNSLARWYQSHER